jgi:hypothetical protein
MQKMYSDSSVNVEFGRAVAKSFSSHKIEYYQSANDLCMRREQLAQLLLMRQREPAWRAANATNSKP